MKESTEAVYFSLLINAMSDVSMEKTLIIYLRYNIMVARQVCCRFIWVVGRGGMQRQSIRLLVAVLKEKGLALEKMQCSRYG